MEEGRRRKKKTQATHKSGGDGGAVSASLLYPNTLFTIIIINIIIKRSLIPLLVLIIRTPSLTGSLPDTHTSRCKLWYVLYINVTFVVLNISFFHSFSI